MKIKTILMLSVTGFFMACTDEDPATPDALACFEYAPETEIKAGDEITFTNCSENATSFAWDFGDGDISTEENPTHAYDAGGEYTVKMVAANETSADSVSTTINVASTNYFTIDGTSYPLSWGILGYNGGDLWHSLVLMSNQFVLSNEDDIVGVGNIFTIDILSGNAKFDVAGSYSLNTASFDGTPEDIAAMRKLEIYNGISTVAFDYNFSDESPAANNLTYNGDESFTNFNMTISENNGIYDINISVTIDGKDVVLVYKGDLIELE